MSKTKIETTITRDLSLIDVSAWHRGYTEGMKKWLGWSYSDSVFYIHDGYTEIMRPSHEHFVDFRDCVISRIESDSTWFDNELKKLNKLILNIFKFYDNSKKKLTELSSVEMSDIYKKYVDYISQAMGPFTTMLWFPIWLENDEVGKEKYKREIDLAIFYRKKTERLFPGGAELTSLILFRVSKEVLISEPLIRVLSADELLNYLKKGLKPDYKILEDRVKGFIYSKKGIILTGSSPAHLESVIDHIGYELVDKKHDNADVKELKGLVACRGKVKGRVRIIMSKRDIPNLLEGEVLIAAMTTPEYLPALKKAIAFVTDEGGITSHAAIVAREMKKPCIIGTKIATKVLKDGDLVEVDANKGIMKIIK